MAARQRPERPAGPHRRAGDHDDSVGLTAPWNVAMSYVKADYEYRIRYWDCALTSNDVLGADGKTTTILPGEQGHKQPQNDATRTPESNKSR